MEGSELRARVERLGMSQRQLAALARVHEVTVSNWLADRHEAPDMIGVVLDAYELLPTGKRALLFPRMARKRRPG